MSDRVMAPPTAAAVNDGPDEAVKEFDEVRVMREADIMRGEVLAALFQRACAAVKAKAGRAMRAIEQVQSMRALASLDDKTLADIGLQRGDIPALCLGETHPGAVRDARDKAADAEPRRAA